MDEPTSSLQRADVDRLFALIRRLRAQGLGIVYISHFLEEIREIADVFTVLRDGRSVATGGNRRRHQRAARGADGRAAGGEPVPARTAARSPASVLSVKNLAARPPCGQASFELRRGEVLGIAGLMGSGRTEMVRAIFGLDPMTAGDVTVGGARRRRGRRSDRACCARGSRPGWAI